MRFAIYTSVVIQRPSQEVWDALVQISHYHLWTKTITSAGGPRVETVNIIEPDQTIELRLSPLNRIPQTVKVKIIELLAGQKITWLGHFLNIPGIINGRHSFEIKSLSKDKTELFHYETFEGLLVPFVKNSVLNFVLRPTFIKFNEDLKRYLEK